MSFQGTIVLQKAKQVAPEGLIKHLMKLYPSIVTIAAMSGDKIEMDGTSKYSFENVKEYQELFSDQDLIMYFGKCPPEYPEETVPPFIMYEKAEGHPSLVLFTDGDFSNYAKAESSHSPDFFAAQNYFAPKIGKWLEGKDNLTNVLSKLKDDEVVENIQNSFLNRGCVLFLSITGEAICIEKNNDKDQLIDDWGYVSNAHGWSAEAAKPEPVAEPVAAAPKTSRFKLGGGAKPQAVNTEAANDKPAPKSEEHVGKTQETPAKVTKSTVREPAPTPDVGGGKQEEEEPTVKVVKDVPHNFGKKQKQAWFNQELGKLPFGYKDLKQIEVTIPQSKLVEHLAMGWKHAGGAKVTVEKKNNRDNKNVAPEHIKPAATSVPQVTDPKRMLATKRDDGYVPFKGDKEAKPVAGVKSVDQQKELQAEMKVILGLNSQDVPVKPGNIHELVTKLPSAAEQAGLKSIHNLFGLSMENITNLRVKYPEWFDLQFAQLLAIVYKEWEATGKLKKEEPAGETEKEEVAQEVKAQKPGTPGRFTLRKSAAA